MDVIAHILALAPRLLKDSGYDGVGLSVVSLHPPPALPMGPEPVLAITLLPPLQPGNPRVQVPVLPG